jgi:hypothetical protein
MPSAADDIDVRCAESDETESTMTDDESRPDEEYEPEDKDPDAPIASKPEVDGAPPVEAPAPDWLDQQREVPLEDEEPDAAE